MKKGLWKMKRAVLLVAVMLLLFSHALAEQWITLPGGRYELALPDRLVYSAPEAGDDGVEAWISDTLEVDAFAVSLAEARSLLGLKETLTETAEFLANQGKEAEVREVGGIEMLCLRDVDDADGTPCIAYLFPDGDSLIEIDFWYATPEAGEETASVISTIRAVNAEK